MVFLQMHNWCNLYPILEYTWYAFKLYELYMLMQIRRKWITVEWLWAYSDELNMIEHQNMGIEKSMTTHLQTGWLSLIHNVLGQCTKLLFCWKIFSGKDERDSITSLPLSPLNCPLDRSYTCTPYIVMKFYLFLLEMQLTELYIHLRN